MRTFVRVVAIVIAIGAVLVTVAGIAGPPVLALLQHPADSSRLPSAASVAGRARPRLPPPPLRGGPAVLRQPLGRVGARRQGIPTDRRRALGRRRRGRPSPRSDT